MGTQKLLKRFKGFKLFKGFKVLTPISHKVLALFSLWMGIGILISCESFPPQTKAPIQADSLHLEKDSKEVVVAKPSFLQKKAPKLGLILGAGGTLTYAHIGLLQELENQKIPLHAIGGLEWGALVAAAYAQSPKAHSIEWQLLKLPTKAFRSQGFFSSGQGGAQLSQFNNFLKDTFGNRRIGDLELPFVCPYTHLPKRKMGLKARGSLQGALRSCWPMAPHFQIKRTGAHPLALGEVAQALRNQGAQVIIYVDVLGQSPLLKTSFVEKFPAISGQWVGLKALKPLATGVVDQVISLGLGNSHINSYNSLRSIIRMGQVKSKSAVKELVESYAY